MKIGFLSHLDRNLYLFRLPVMLELIRLGHEVYAIAPEGADTPKMAELGIKTVTYPIERGSLNPLKELRAIHAIYDALKPLKMDVLHTFTVKPNIYGTIAGKMAKIPRIVNSVTGLGSFYIDESFKAKTVRFIIEALYRRTFNLASTVVFQNLDDLGYFVQKKLLNEKKTTIIEGSGIDTKLWRKKSGAKKDSLTVLMVARALLHKGVKEYYAAAESLGDKYPNVRFLYAGGVDTANHSSLDENFMRSAKNVEYLGERDDIKELMNEADIFVLPSYREGMPRTILEACSMGLPVVTTDAPGCRDAVEDGVNGFLVKVGDAKSLEIAIEKLICDEELRVSMGEAGRKRAVEKFDVEAIVRLHLDIY